MADKINAVINDITCTVIILVIGCYIFIKYFYPILLKKFGKGRKKSHEVKRAVNLPEDYIKEDKIEQINIKRHPDIIEVCPKDPKEAWYAIIHTDKHLVSYVNSMKEDPETDGKTIIDG